MPLKKKRLSAEKGKNQTMLTLQYDLDFWNTSLLASTKDAQYLPFYPNETMSAIHLWLSFIFRSGPEMAQILRLWRYSECIYMRLNAFSPTIINQPTRSRSYFVFSI
jgi:hypothetical protein